MISLSVQLEFTVGLRCTAQMIAFAITSSGLMRTPANDGLSRSRRTNSIVRVAFTSVKTLTCGAVNALDTIAVAIALRTPLTGIRSSRSSGHAGVSMLRNTLACWACR